MSTAMAPEPVAAPNANDAAMPEVVVIGAGLCGLALAHQLQARGVDWLLFDARQRPGGRVLTRHGAQGQPLDLGPSWYWPATQPSITRLVEDLGLPTLAQPDDGRVRWLDDPNRAARLAAMHNDGRLVEGGLAREGGVHGGARRLAGGMAELVLALTDRLPAQRLRLGWALQAVRDAGDHVLLQLAGPGHAALQMPARRVVLALPPRLAASTLAFDPPLLADLRATLQDLPTWMATAAKVAAAYDRPFWREQGLSGNACVTHAQAVLAETFDLSPAEGSGALGGFVALAAGARQPLRPRSLQLLIDSQLGMLFGQQALDAELHVQDWAAEPWTCSPLDLADTGLPVHPSAADAAPLQQPQWQGKLLFGGSETASRHPGYLEGALNAAARLQRQLLVAEAATRAEA